MTGKCLARPYGETVGALLPDLRERRLEITGLFEFNRHECDAECPGCELRVLVVGHEAGEARLPDDRETRELGDRLFEQLHQFPAKLWGLDRHSRDVTTRPREACYKPVGGWLRRGEHDNGDGTGRLFSGKDLRHE